MLLLFYYSTIDDLFYIKVFSLELSKEASLCDQTFMPNSKVAPVELNFLNIVGFYLSPPLNSWA